MRGRWINAEWNPYSGFGRWGRGEWGYGRGAGFRARLGMGFGAGPWCANRGWANQNRLAYLKEVESILEHRLHEVRQLISELEGNPRVRPESE